MCESQYVFACTLEDTDPSVGGADGLRETKINNAMLVLSGNNVHAGWRGGVEGI